MKEYRIIPGFKRYKASNTGEIIGMRLQSLMTPYKNKKGYLILTPRNDDGKMKCTPVHRLIWMAFNGPIPAYLMVDHIDNNPSNNHISNLQLLTNRDNVIKGKSQKPKLFKYTGVSWDSRRKCYKASIKINKKSKTIGRFKKQTMSASSENGQLHPYLRGYTFWRKNVFWRNERYTNRTRASLDRWLEELKENERSLIRLQ